MNEEATTPQAGFEAITLALARNVFLSAGGISRFAFVDEGLRGAGVMLVQVPSAPPTRPQVNDAIMQMFRALLAKRGAVGVAMVSEVWHVEQLDAQERSDLPVDLGDAPERKEAVVVNLEHHAVDGGKPRMWSAEITRVEGIATLGPWRLFGPHGELSGRMIGLLPPRMEGATA